MSDKNKRGGLCRPERAEHDHREENHEVALRMGKEYLEQTAVLKSSVKPWHPGGNLCWEYGIFHGQSTKRCWLLGQGAGGPARPPSLFENCH